MIRGLVFDINGTTTDILTDEGYDDMYRVLGNFLDYQGIALRPEEIRRLYFEGNQRQRQERRQSGEAFPEFDVVALFREIVERFGSDYTRSLPEEKRRVLPGILAEVFRAASRFRLEPYPDVHRVLDELRQEYRLAALSDGQGVWGIPELRSVGLANYFDPVIISSDLGFRKPDRRMFELALEKLQLAADEVIFIGNDMRRDVLGAKQADIKTVFFKSNQGEQRPQGAEPDYIIHRFAELPSAVRFLARQ